MTEEQALQLLTITRQKTDELFEELIAALRNAPAPIHAERIEVVGPLHPTPRSSPEHLEGPSPLEGPPLNGDWEEIGRSATETYDWPDGNHDEYVEFVSYRGTGDYAGMSLALGYRPEGDVVGFVLGEGPKRGITWFYPADDFDQTREKVSLIRGGGPNGRSGFAPDEPLPSAYGGFKVDVLRHRKAGKWNVQGVVAKEDDYKTMLGHTALQARLRGLS
jgi:hypothetical protein